jgi:hypothetical protein
VRRDGMRRKRSFQASNSGKAEPLQLTVLAGDDPRRRLCCGRAHALAVRHAHAVARPLDSRMTGLARSGIECQCGWCLNPLVPKAPHAGAVVPWPDGTLLSRPDSQWPLR